MKRYSVTIYETHSYSLDVEAENETEARQKANERLANDGDLPCPEYCNTLDVDEWRVDELEEPEPRSLSCDCEACSSDAED